MKRGKRQIIERPNMFGNDDDQSQSSQHSNNPNFLVDNWSSLGFPNTERQKPHVNTNENQKFTDQIINKNKNSHEKQQSQIINPISAVSQEKQQNSGEDERKRRLQMLRQKYLKSGQNQETKQQEHKHEFKQIKSQVTPVFKAEQKNLRQEKLAQKKEQSFESKIFFDSLTNKNNENENDLAKQKYEVRYKKQRENMVEQKQENEKPISKPTETGPSLDHRKVTPPPPPPPLHQQRKKKAVPPPPGNRIQYVSASSPQDEINISSSQNIKDNVTPSFPSFNNEYQYHQQQNSQSKISKPYEQQQQKPAYTQKDSNSLFTAISNWLNNSSTTAKNDNGQSKNKILNQLSSNQSVFVRGMIENFILSNTEQFSLEQSAFVQKHLCQFGAVSNLTKLFIAIKCGDQTLIKYFRQFDFLNTLSELVLVKQCLLENERNRFVKFLLNNLSIRENYLPTIVQFSPNSPQIYQYLLRNNQLENPAIVAQILCIMRSNISEKISPTYFKLINYILPQIQDGETLESILKLIGNISFQSAYQLKKDTKLKIIQKIDKQSGDSRSNQFLSKQQHPSQFQRRNQREEDKQKTGSGLSNLMGYVNQTIKKIASQIPEKIQNAPAPVEEPKETMTYDPVLKRWLINGKVPEDQDGQTETFSPENEEKPKKKVPPPPPPPRIKNNPSNRQSTNSNPYNPSVQQPSIQRDPQVEQEHQPLQQEPGLNNQFRNSPPPPPPPPRMGLKGMANKKPKLQARYT